MYSNVSLRGLAYALFAALTISFAIFTMMIFQTWRIESAGVWSTGTVTGISHCVSSKGVTLSTVYLKVRFTDVHGQQQTVQTDCEYNRYPIGTSIRVRYLPDNPSHVITQDDIGGGQGEPLVGLLVLDALCVPALVLLTIYALRRMRRQDAWRTAQRRARLDALQAQFKSTHRKPGAQPGYRRQTAITRRTRRTRQALSPPTKQPPRRG